MFSGIVEPKWRLLILCIISMVSVWIAFKPILKIAVKKNIVDNPDSRKLQKIPIPVLGGAAVFFGIIIGIGFFKTMFAYPAIFPIITSAVAMLYVGITDDILSVKPWKRILFEIGAALLIIYGNRFYICNFQGFLGIDQVPLAVGIILSAITFTGLVNSINMIDGVDGLCSGFCIMILTFFGLLFFLAFDYSFAALSAVSIGAMIPFFIHNLVGLKSKMFLGDGGTMVMGTVISSMVFEILGRNFGDTLLEKTAITLSFPLDFSLIAFCLAVLSIPVFDTLRVMFIRILQKRSPFSPDNNHLHHIFTKVGFSYVGTTARELLLNLLVIALFFISWIFGASVNAQVFIVILSGILVDFGTSRYLKKSAGRPGSRAALRLEAKTRRSHIERKGFWLKLQKLVDEEQL